MVCPTPLSVNCSSRACRLALSCSKIVRSTVENLGGCGVVDREPECEDGGEASWDDDGPTLEVLLRGDKGDVAEGDVAICSKRGRSKG